MDRARGPAEAGARAREERLRALPGAHRRRGRLGVEFRRTELAEVVLVVPDVHRDARVCCLETYHARKYRDGGIDARFVQDNQSRSGRGTLRGLHAQVRTPQGKLVRVVRGEIWDVAVDIRPGSPSFGQWVGETLSDSNWLQLSVPPGAG